MILVIHITAALASIGSAAYVFFDPSRKSLLFNYGLVMATAATGMYMIVTQPVHILQTCLSGILYIGFVSTVLLLASRRLAAQAVKAKNNRLK
ncbi:MAG TPA: hypothetical protein VFT16_00120 [Candidatus Saccharimonadales bacterium]|nr:hypothetical protein [Candidatus Saccharimonadales bacterium]